MYARAHTNSLDINSTKAKNLKKDFLGLPRLEQLELMQYFLEVFATKRVTKEEEDFVLSDEWKEELDRRSQEVKSGKAKLFDNDEVLLELGIHPVNPE